MAAYATPAQMLSVYDSRSVGDLCSDTGTRVSPTALLTDPVLASALNAASGKIDAALQAGGLYLVSDLQALAASLANLTNVDSTPYLLVSVTCDIAMLLLMMRRPAFDMDRLKKMIDLVDGPQGSLTQLRQGKNVFGLPGQIDAGLPSVDGPTTLEYQNLNLLRDRTLNYYPGRVLPNNR